MTDIRHTNGCIYISQPGGNNHGVVSHAKTTNRKYRIIETPDNNYRVKRRFFGTYVYIRKGLKILEFDTFSDVVQYVIKRRRKDGNIRGH